MDAAFRFAHPWAFGLLLIAAGALTWRFAQVRRGKANPPPALRYSDLRLVGSLPVSWRARLIWLPDALAAIAWLALLVALARPQGGVAREVLRGQGIDIVLALDISGSMAALDFEPVNRLTAAKSVIGDFIAGREFDRIGLVVFARGAFLQSPLTLDYTVLRDLLDDVRLVTEIIDADGNPLLLDGTAVGLGIASAAGMLRDSAAPSKVIIALTDGDNNAALDPITAAGAAAVFDIRVYAVGMGKTGLVPVPDADGNIVTVESDLDEDALAALAEAGGGLYFRAEDADGLRRIYDEIDRLERSRVERQVFVRWRDYAQAWLAAAFVLLLIERVLRRTLLQRIP
jgi:Ca-activated chloride channel family protein